MSEKILINQIAEETKKVMEKESSGHDWWHAYRVWQLAKRIADSEKTANRLIVELAAILHDIADWKFNGGDETIGPKKAREVMEKYGVEEKTIGEVVEIISTMSFKGANVKTSVKTLEGKIVQDADKLDAIGAMGIARTFAYGGHAGRAIHDPEMKPRMHNSKEEYFNSKSSTINHFYEKLLLLRDRMNTETAKKLAESRHEFLELYLDRFYKEWEGLN